MRIYNWIFRGITEWSISRAVEYTDRVYRIDAYGLINVGYRLYEKGLAVRPTFYLNKDVKINKTAHTGSKTDPYRVGNFSYVYWNDNFSGTEYTSTQVPTGSGLNGTYQTREQLVTAYTSWEDVPIYIKTTKVNGTVTGHTACLWYNNREFCIAPNYWTGTIGVEDATAGANTKAKLKADMENALGITIADSSCGSGARDAYCDAGDFNCSAISYGDVSCYSNVADENCGVNGSGYAGCG